MNVPKNGEKMIDSDDIHISILHFYRLMLEWKSKRMDIKKWSIFLWLQANSLPNELSTKHEEVIKLPVVVRWVPHFWIYQKPLPFLSDLPRPL